MSVAAVTALCGIAASCSNVLGDRSLFTGATKNQKDIITSSYADTTPLPAPTSGVTRADLPPPPGSYASNGPVGTYQAPATPTYQAPAYTPSPNYAPGATTLASNGETYQWSAVGGKVITVGQGETLDLLAVKYGVPQNQILNSNQLSSASQVTAGRVLVIPHLVGVQPGQSLPGQSTVPTAAPAPTPGAVPAPAPVMAAAKPQAGTGTYTVLTGDTLYSISQKNGTTPETLIAINNLQNQSQLRTGQVLKLPGTPTTLAPSTAVASAMPKPSLAPNGQTVQVAGVAKPGTTTVTAVEMPVAKPAAVPAVANGQIPATQASLTPPKAAVVDPLDGPSANGTTFRWPVRGRVIAGFGSSPAGQRNDGINLSVPEGTSVKAAEAGTVIYAGNELEGYGNLILVRHADGWVSAYAHNKDLAVKRGDAVVRGQIIAHAGMTGSVSAPQVHFELRQGSKPVNPLDYLSG